MPANDEATPILPGLSPIHGRAIEARFDGAMMSSDGGLLVLREIIHHERDAAGNIATRIIREGPVHLDPPGVDLRDLFASGSNRNPISLIAE